MKILCIVLENYQDIELVSFVGTLKKSKYLQKIRFYSPEKKHLVVGSNEIGTIICDNQKIDVNDYDLIYIPGGPAAQALATNKSALNLIKEFINAKKWIVAHCDSPNAIYQASLLVEKEFISYPPANRWAKISPKRIKDQKTLVHVDGKYISGRSPLASFELALKVIELLVSKKEAQIVKDALFGIEDNLS